MSKEALQEHKALLALNQERLRALRALQRSPQIYQMKISEIDVQIQNLQKSRTFYQNELDNLENSIEETTEAILKHKRAIAQERATPIVTKMAKLKTGIDALASELGMTPDQLQTMAMSMLLDDTDSSDKQE